MTVYFVYALRHVVPSGAISVTAASAPSCETEPPKPVNIEEKYPRKPELKPPRVQEDPGAGEGLEIGDTRKVKLPGLLSLITTFPALGHDLLRDLLILFFFFLRFSKQSVH